MSAACTHGMPSPASCADCMYEGNLTPPPATEPETVVMRKKSAQFAGHCGACNLPILGGQPIALTTRDRWIHDRCVA